MKYTFLTLSLFLVLTGCAKLKVIDQIKIIQGLGYDIEGKNIIGFALYPLYKNTHSGNPLILLNGQSDTIQGTITSFTAQSQHPIELGQTRTVVLGDAFAKRGISELVSVLVRDPLLGSNAKVILTNQTASQVLTQSLKQPPYYLANLVEQNITEGNTPITNFHLLLNQYYGKGQDVYLPILNIAEKGLVTMDGTGIFKGDKLHVKIHSKEALLLKLLTDGDLTGKYEFTTDNNERALLSFLYGKRSISLLEDKTVISLTLHTQLQEYPASINPLSPSEMNRFKKQMEEELQSKIKALLTKFQENGVDPVGFGELYRGKQRDWTEEHFQKDTYPSLHFVVKTEVILSQSGVGS
ncbi:Ger(x)C family spore germination protein [Brevibacillus nitrificans]|uniref:Ger(x)C family spore germination protein n=1 Tax=Brevibacillus nitrificans TaxID=651560 RepID=UPI002626590E|nr:Ger(x)C family spore germination protein [Brevibacillus nitrificans]MED1791372.1 Ger(x)C family spore germination protein [Brevibacillus nitrificans]